ncbi:MAG: hypothetical protein ACLUD2_15395 [Clostridium sp.]
MTAVSGADFQAAAGPGIDICAEAAPVTPPGHPDRTRTTSPRRPCVIANCAAARARFSVKPATQAAESTLNSEMGIQRDPPFLRPAGGG